MSTSTRNRRPQSPKGMGNRAYWDAMQELRRSSATERHRDKSKYSRSSDRRERQKGWA